nr:MAG: capsid protein [Nodaviridae sp.]
MVLVQLMAESGNMPDSVAKETTHKKRRNRRRNENVAKPEVKIVETERKPRRNRSRRRRRTTANGDVSTAQFPGVIARTTNSAAPHLVRSMRKLRLKGLSSLPEEAQEFIIRHCDPGSEMVTVTENSKVPDNAMPNSTLMELREAFIIRVPGTTQESQLPLDGAMWTLTMIHTGMFRTPMILVANLANSEMSQADRLALINVWNSVSELAEFPNWSQVSTDTYYCVVRWTALNRLALPTARGPTDVQQFRVTADSITVFNNTPDLVNQGMVVGGQWPAKIGKQTEQPDRTLAGFSETVVYGSFLSTQASLIPTGTTGWTFRLPSVSSSLVITSSNNAGAVMADPGTSWHYVKLYVGVGVASVVCTATASHSLTVGASSVSAGDVITYSLIQTAAALWTITVEDTTTSVNLYSSGPAVNPTSTNGSYVLTVLDDLEIPLVTRWSLPPTSTQAIMQSTPKAVYMSAKEQNGVYMVKRVFQPVFNVQSANEYAPVVMTDSDLEDRNFALSQRDTFDLNYGVGVVVWSSIPTSCAPAVKMIRDVEIVAGENSVLATFMKSNERDCPAAIEIASQIAKHHPFMYPESYNSLGGLLGMITNVVSKIPILGNVVGAVGNIVKTFTGAEKEQQPTATNSQNRLGSTNIDELAKLIPMILDVLRR